MTLHIGNTTNVLNTDEPPLTSPDGINPQIAQELLPKDAPPSLRHAVAGKVLFKQPKDFSKAKPELTINPGIPVFPRFSMIGSLAELAVMLGAGTEMPEPFLFMDAVCVAGLIMSGRHKLRIRANIRSDTRLYVSNIGTSDFVKKSSSADATVEFFYDLKIPGWSVCENPASAEGLADELRLLRRHPACTLMPLHESWCDMTNWQLSPPRCGSKIVHWGRWWPAYLSAHDTPIGPSRTPSE